MLDKYVASKDAVIYNRCKYIVEEIQRLLNGCTDLDNGNIAALGKKMFTTHEGLSKLYEVSCKEADWLVEQVKNDPDILGARMMGGGFGGCTINIVKSEAIDSLVDKLSKGYKEKMGLKLSAYISNIENGTEIVAIS